MMKVTVFLAEGFEEVEALCPIDLLRRCGATVTVVGVTGKTVTGAHGVPMVTDCEIADYDCSQDDMIVLPGGMPGTKNLYESALVRKAVADAVASNRYVAAICAAPSIIFGGMGILNGKKAVCYPGMEDGMAGATPVDAPFVWDGKVITGRGAGTAMDFALALCEALFGKDAAVEQAQAVCYAHYGK